MNNGFEQQVWPTNYHEDHKNLLFRPINFKCKIQSEVRGPNHVNGLNGFYGVEFFDVLFSLIQDCFLVRTSNNNMGRISSWNTGQIFRSHSKNKCL